MRERALIIRGGGFLGSGRYDVPVKVFGSLKIEGDVSLASLECHGSIIVNGSAEILGNLIVNGSILSKDITVRSNSLIRGGAKIDGDFACLGNTEIRGGILVSGDIRCTKLKMKGGVSLAGDLVIKENCSLEGGLKVSGDTEVDGDLIIKLSSHGTNVVEGDMKIGGNLKVLKTKGIPKLIIHGHVSVEGEAHLEFTEVRKDLSARGIYLGPNTVVHGNVYYLDKIELDPTAKVKGEAIKISRN